MITKDIIEHFKLTAKDLKPLFTAKKRSDKVQKLVDLITDRIDSGRDHNLRDYRMYWAMDTIWDASFSQITPTILNAVCSGLSDADLMSKKTVDKLKSIGLTQFISQTTKGDSNEKCFCIDLPTFTQITIPLAKAYTMIRAAKLWDNRDLVPFLKYEPVINTKKNRARSEIVTSAIEQQAQLMGYREQGKQWIMNALMYGTAIMFPREEWHTEKEMQFDESGDPVEKVKKAGMVYNLPHPSRVFWDRNYRLGTMNYDTGCEYAGYWRVVRYGDILDNKLFWNADKVATFTNDFRLGHEIFFNEVYPCRMEFPFIGQAAGSGAGEMDRESSVVYYTSSDYDKGVVLTDIFIKIKPKDWGIGDYKHPVWFRFVMANDTDPVYVSAIPYSPLLYIGYDAHEERSRNSSLLLEIAPFQDHMSNLLTQQILTAKTNLAKAVFYNSDLIPKQYMDLLENRGQKFYTDLSFIPFSGRKQHHLAQDVRQAFYPVNFPLSSTVELVNAFRTLLDVLERILVFSAQEVAASASHEQTAEEIMTTRQSVSTRVKFTDSFIEDGWFGWKKQLYDALMGYATEDVWAEVPNDPMITTQVLKDMGFTIDEDATPGDGSKRMVKGSAQALRMSTWASTREGSDRIRNPELAAGMAQLTQAVMADPINRLAIGSEQIIEIYNTIGRLAGLPRDFRLHIANREIVERMEKQQGGANDDQMRKVLEQMAVQILEQAAKQSVEIVTQAVQPLADRMAETEKAVMATAQQIGPLKEQIEKIAAGLAEVLAAVSAGASQQNAPRQIPAPEIGEPISVGTV